MKSRLTWAGVVLGLAVLVSLCFGADGLAQTKGAMVEESQVLVEFDYKKQPGHASNQFAVWVEDSDGNLVKTVYATSFTAEGGYKFRPDSIAGWVKKAGLSSLSQAEIDGITGATPQSGRLSYVWDLTDLNGAKVAAGKYTVLVEGTLRWKNRVLYAAEITLGGKSETIQPTPEFFYARSTDRQPALTDSSPENSMIGAVKVTFMPKSHN